MTDKQLKLQKLADAFAGKLPSMLENIDAAFDLVERKPASSSALHDLLALVHSLTGSSGTFGFMALSSYASELEMQLSQLYDAGRPLQDEELVTLKKKLAGLEPLTAHQNTITVIEDKPETVDSHSGKILVVEDDALLAGELISQLSAYGWDMEVFPNRQEAQAALKHSKPAAIIADVVLPEGDLAGIEMLQQLTDEGFGSLPMIVMSARWDWEARLAAVRAGADAYLTKPLDYACLAEILEQFMSDTREDPYRVLIVDDSESLAKTHAAVLSSAGMESEVVTSPGEVLHTLERFRPELILMDLYMPECTGIEVAKVIRQDAKYLSVPIVYLSTEVAKKKQIEAMKIGGDEFLTKPIAPQELISAVTTRAERFRSLATRIQQDSLTSLLNHTALKMQLELEFARAQRSDKECVLAMLDIDHFKSINDNHGHPVGDKVLRSISKIMRSRLRKGDVIGRYGGEEFAILMPDTSLKDAVQVVDELRESFSRVSFAVADGDFSATLSAGLAAVSHCRNVDALIAAADDYLYAAKNSGRNCVRYE